MPNNLAFNNVANELKTAIYGTTDGGVTFTPISVDSAGNVNVSVVNTALVSVVNTANVSVVNTANVSVVNTANVSVVNTANVSVVNTALVSVVNSVTTLNDVSTDVYNQLVSGVTTTTILQKDTLAKNMYSYYVNNQTGDTVQVRLQVSPVQAETFFTNDSNDVRELANGAKTVLVPKNYLNYTRVLFTSSTNANSSLIAYYNAQS